MRAEVKRVEGIRKRREIKIEKRGEKTKENGGIITKKSTKCQVNEKNLIEFISYLSIDEKA